MAEEQAPKGETRIPVVNPQGKRGTLPSSALTPEALKLGYRALTPEEASDAREAKEKGALGGLEVGAAHAVDSALFGIPGAIAKNVTSDETQRKFKELERQHETAATVGDVLGTAAGIGATIASGGTSAILEGSTEAALKAGLPKLAARAAGHLATNAALAAPAAAAELAKGHDPQAVGEAYLLAVGLGSTLGVAAEHVEPAVVAAGKGLQKLAAGSQKILGVAEEQGGALGKHLAKEGLRTAATMAFGRAGYLGASAVEHMASLPGLLNGDLVETMSKNLATAAGSAAKRGASTLSMAIDSKASLERLTKSLEADTQDPPALPRSAGLPDEVHQAATMQHLANQKYLLSVAPRDPEALHPLNDGSWKPTLRELRDFNDRLQVVRDPLSVVPMLYAGTLDSTHVEALNSAYPALSQVIKTGLVSSTSDPQVKQALQHRRKLFDLLVESPTSSQAVTPQAQPMATPSSQLPSPAVPSEAKPRRIQVRQKSMAKPTSLERVTMGG